MKTIHLQCDYCQVDFEKPVALHAVSLRRNQKIYFCSPKCTYAFRKNIKYFECKFCKQQVLQNEPDQIFCSTSCSNKARAKPKPPKTHKIGCLNDDLTLQELRKTYTTNQYHAKLRMDARRRYDQSGRPKTCFNCGYEKHVEICHIRDIKNFDSSSTVSKVNDLNNLIALDPRCHWEFDNGHLPQLVAHVRVELTKESL